MKSSLADYFACGLAIGAVLIATLAIVAFAVRPLSTSALAEYHVIVDFFAGLLAYGLLSALVVRVLLAFRSIVPGDYTMDSPEFAYWKILTIVYRLGQKALLPFTPEVMRPVVVRLFGGDVGANVAIGGTVDDPYLVTIGHGAVLGNNSLVSGSLIAGGRITLGRVSIGAGATIGANAVVLPGSDVGDRTMIIGGALVLAGTRIPAGETWRGNPARKWQ